MVRLAFNHSAEIKRLYIWVTAVVDVACFVSIKHTIDTQWEEFSVIYHLNCLLALFGI